MSINGIKLPPAKILRPGTTLDDGTTFPFGGCILADNQGGPLRFAAGLFPCGTAVPQELLNGSILHAGAHLANGEFVAPGAIGPNGLLRHSRTQQPSVSGQGRPVVTNGTARHPPRGNPSNGTNQMPPHHRRTHSNPVQLAGGFPRFGTMLPPGGIGTTLPFPVAGLGSAAQPMLRQQFQRQNSFPASRHNYLQPDITMLQLQMAQMSLGAAQAQAQAQSMAAQPGQHPSPSFPAYRPNASIPAHVGSTQQHKPAPNTLDTNQHRPSAVVSSSGVTANSSAAASNKRSKARRKSKKQPATLLEYYGEVKNIKLAFKDALEYRQDPDEYEDDVQDLKEKMGTLRGEIQEIQKLGATPEVYRGQSFLVALVLKLLESPGWDPKTALRNFRLFDDPRVASSFLWVVFSDEEDFGAMEMLDWAKLLGLTSLPRMRAVPLQTKRDIVHALRSREIVYSGRFKQNKAILVRAGVVKEDWAPKYDKKANAKVMEETFVATLGGHFLMTHLSKGGLTFENGKKKTPYTTELDQPLLVLLEQASKELGIPLPNLDGFEMGEQPTQKSAAVPTKSEDPPLQPTPVVSDSAVSASGEDQKPPAVPNPGNEEEKKDGDSQSSDGTSSDCDEYIIVI